jgi:co-chaperonin GroES (HSP10)
MSDWKPMNGYVAIKLVDKETGIIIPDEYKNLSDTGEVIAIADGIDDICVGDKILYKNQSGHKLDDLYLIKIEEVMGIC